MPWATLLTGTVQLTSIIQPLKHLHLQQTFLTSQAQALTAAVRIVC